MVVKTSDGLPSGVDLAHVAFFLGLRVNELVMEHLAKAGFKGVRESHGYLIQHLIESERSVTDLARRMDVTQQAASKAVAELVGLGILETAPAKDRRAKRIRLSQRGWECVRLGRRARSQIDRGLVNAAGTTHYEMARSTLLTYLRTLGGIKRVSSRRVRKPG